MMLMPFPMVYGSLRLFSVTLSRLGSSGYLVIAFLLWAASYQTTIDLYKVCISFVQASEGP